MKPLILLLLLTRFGLDSPAPAQNLPHFALGQSQPWTSSHDVEQVEITSEGMKITGSGSDPYLYGPIVGCSG